MRLSELLGFFDIQEISGSTDIEITDICYHSGKVSAGALFVAIPGNVTDGRRYAMDAVKNGAIAIVLEGEFFDNLGITQIRISGVRRALALISSAFFVHPTKEFYLCGVTGTNGKTTLTHLVCSLWQVNAIKTGLVGTVGIYYDNVLKPSSVTTPESRDLQETFRQMCDQGVTHVAIEVSSHAVVQNRVTGCQYDACVFTNLTQDHLDYHGNLEAYYSAKEELFLRDLSASTKKNKLAILYGESNFSSRLVAAVKEKNIAVMTYGEGSENDIHPIEVQMNLSGIHARLSTPAGLVNINSPLMGSFNLLNIMGATAVALHSGLPIAVIEEGFKKATGASGRLERIIDPAGRLVFVDYAHSPDALTNVLQSIKALNPPCVITVFGCGGDRDKTKRPLMGAEAAKYSDICLITSDNPRTEAADHIINDILPGIKAGGQSPLKEGRGYVVEPDRKKAIEKALELAGRNDVVLVAGKGHEDYQIIGTQKQHFSDQEVIREYFKK